MKKLAFIGMGNMAMALARGFIEAGKLAGGDIVAFAPNREKLCRNAKTIGFEVAESAAAAAAAAEWVLLACKPQQIEGVLREIGGVMSGKVLLSVALGWDFARYSQYVGRELPQDVQVQFIMPNTPAKVGEGVFLLEESSSLTVANLAAVKDLLAPIGTVVTLPSRLMGIGGAVSGCGPAFVDMLLQAFADAGVRYGLPRETAQLLVSKTVLGAAALQLQTGESPEALKDAVCSPGGSTIRGVTALESAGFRAAIHAAIEAIMNK